MATATNHELKTFKDGIKRRSAPGMIKNKDAATDAEMVVYGAAIGFGGEKRTAKQQTQARMAKARKKKPPRQSKPRDEFSNKKTTKQQAKDYDASNTAGEEARKKRVRRAREEAAIIKMLGEDDL